MPRLRYSLAAEIHKPLAIPGSPDIQGELTLDVASAVIESGSGSVIASGWASTSLSSERVDLPPTVVDVRNRRAVVPVASSGAAGTVTVAVWSSWEKADATALLRVLRGILAGRDVEASGTLGLIEAKPWEPSAPLEPTVPDIDPLRPSAQTAHTTAFLRGNAKITTHTLLRDNMPEAEWRELIAYNKAQGYGVMYVYAANEGDYGRQWVEYAASKSFEWRRRLQAVVDSGARVIMWGCADDSPGLAKRTQAQWRNYWGQIHAACGDLISEWVTGLECDERWSASTTQALTRMLKELTGKPVGVHTTGLSAIAYAQGADKFYLQDTSRNAAKVAAAVRSAKKQFGGQVIAAELHLSGETAAARALGDEAIEAGADGAGTGCTAKGQAILEARARMEPGPAARRRARLFLRRGRGWSRDRLHGEDSPAGLTFTIGKARGRYVQWSPAVDRSDHKAWPIAEHIKGKPDGLLYGRRVGEKTWHKIEWIKQGYQETGLKNAYDDENDPKYDLGWKPGEAVELQIRNTAGKVMADWHNGKWVLR